MRVLIIAILFLSACNNNQEAKKPRDINMEARVSSSNDKLSFQSFHKIPSEIDGCSCLFSKDSINYKKGIYIFADNFENVAFIKVYDKMVRLKRTNTEEFDDFSVKTNYSNEDFELTIKVFEGEESGDESWLNHGKITLITNSGETIETEFFGECGC